MKSFLPRSLPSRALALAIVAGGALLVWVGILRPLQTRYDDLTESIQENASQLGSLTAFIEEAKIHGSAGQAELYRYRTDFLAGAEDSIVIADLQTQLSAQIAARNITLSSASALPPKTRDGLDYLGLRLQIRGEFTNIQQLVHGIETTTPFLFVERASFRSAERAGSVFNGGEEPLAPISMDLDVYGAKWPAAAPAASGKKAQ